MSETVLDRIKTYKLEEVAGRKAALPQSEIDARARAATLSSAAAASAASSLTSSRSTAISGTAVTVPSPVTVIMRGSALTAPAKLKIPKTNTIKRMLTSPLVHPCQACAFAHLMSKPPAPSVSLSFGETLR